MFRFMIWGIVFMFIVQGLEYSIWGLNYDLKLNYEFKFKI